MTLIRGVPWHMSPRMMLILGKCKAPAPVNFIYTIVAMSYEEMCVGVIVIVGREQLKA